MATGWLRGTVKEVPSGDTLVIVGAVKAGPPPEKRITLSSLVAPKLGKRDGSSKDEPFAWASREFLRQKCIGQSVVFKVDYVVEQIGNREFGSVFIGQQDNVALAVVSNGWAKVRAGGEKQSPYVEELKKAEEAAQIAGLGIHTRDPSAVAKSVREIQVGDDAFNTTSFFQTVGKGKTVQAIVESVINGSMIRVTLLPGLQSAVVQVCGVQAPSMGRRAVADPAATADGEASAAPAVPSAASIAASSNAEPFAREAKYLAEVKTLNREVTLVIEGVDKYNNLFATVQVAGAEAGQTDSLAELLVKAGYAKVMEFSVNMMTSGSQRLRDLERAAKQERRAIWTNYVPAPTNQTKLSMNFNGKVVEIVSGDCLVIKDSASGVERRVQLSSLRAPRMSTRDRPADPWATDAKEFLRKRLIGREVEVKMEYTRKVPAAGEVGPSPADRELAFGNVETVPEKGEEKQNVSEMIVARGFAQVVRHRSDEERSCVYERLLECEELAKSSKRGIHSTKEPAANRINDVSLPGSATKAKQYLPFFQRAGKMLAVVEYVLSGHRLKLQIPKEGVCIVFAPSGIKTPSRPQPAANGKPAVQGEPFADEAVAFTREHAMQRDAEVTIETMDKGGTFLGTINILPASPAAKPLNLALSLMRAGLAMIQPNMDPSRLVEGSALAEAQRQAKEARLKIWQNWSPEQEAQPEEEEASATNGATNGSHAARPQEVLEVVVTEVADASEFYVQVVNEPRINWITEQLAAVSLTDGPVIPPELRAGQWCLGQYTLDNQWYRAYIERVNTKEPMYDVFFVDYGNREKLPSSRIRAMDTTLAAVPPQARMCTLAHVKVPEPTSDYAAEAKSVLAQLLSGGQRLLAHVSGREKPGPKDKHPKYAHGKLTVTLVEADTGVNMAAEMLLAGMAQLPKLSKVRDPAAREAVQKLQEYEEEARQAHRGIFVYGDPGDSDDEGAAPAPKPAGAWGKPR
mmetsp:Transcript_6774/g.14968  ORF Transcript_6774/g.14968 Transcript_6774/m.14968 type:complete len:971 (+) Transcript_6774:79-2991(+)